ncbi:hypothetical protein BGZ76_000344 [Entomortierella beljakovae]|nr:hypothetical protein BGZ76_000344 [Entomortierella beljakovae]
MSTSTLQLSPSPNNTAKLDVSYDLKRLKVYSSCLRCRAKKVKCDRKEPCSRCEKHFVECSYRELASVQLDIRQFQRHLNNPKIRKDGAGIITSTATQVIPITSPTTTAVSESSPISPTSTLTTSPSSVALSSGNGLTKKDYSIVSLLPKPSASNNYACPDPIACGSLSTEYDTTPSFVQEKGASSELEGVKVHKVYRRRSSFKTAKVGELPESSSWTDNGRNNVDDSDETQSHDSSTSSIVDRPMSSDIEEDIEDVPIWHAQAVGKHQQTIHEQNLAETFGLAAYLKSKEKAGQTLDYEMELERALAQRMPSSFSRSDKIYTRTRKFGLKGHGSISPYARPSHCQLSSFSSISEDATSSNRNYYNPPPSAKCCCQIAALQGQALDSCPYSSGTNSGYESSSTPSLSQSSPHTTYSEPDHSLRIAYSPTYSPNQSPAIPYKTIAPSSPSPQLICNTSSWQPPMTSFPSILPPLPSPSASKLHSSSSMVSSPNRELPPIQLPESSPQRSVPVFQVERDGEKPIQIECKYNEPNVDAWDMIEKPISRKIPMTTKRGRSIKMEMGWILS